MTYDVDTPTRRYNTEITREYYGKLRPEFEKQTIFSHWNILNGPDKDMVLKTTAGAVNGSYAAVIACVYSNCQHTKGPFTLAGVAAQSFKHGTPWIVAGATYGVTLSVISQFRHKESPIHHMVAGYAAGTMLGSWYKWPMMGVFSGSVMAIAGGFIKFWYDNDMLFSQRVRRQRLFNMYRQNWFMEKPAAEGRDDAEQDVSYRQYKP